MLRKGLSRPSDGRSYTAVRLWCTCLGEELRAASVDIVQGKVQQTDVRGCAGAAGWIADCGRFQVNLQMEERIWAGKTARACTKDSLFLSLRLSVSLPFFLSLFPPPGAT